MWIVIGLGNPGLKYRYSRHNIGFQVLDLLARQHNIKWKKDRFINALTGRIVIGDVKVALVKPMTYMNLSGEAVRSIRDIYSVTAEQMLVVLDDIDLPWLKLRIRTQGSSGGHNGLKSIIGALGTNDFPRMRMGIGRCLENKQIVHHVLEIFKKSEREQLPEFYQSAIDAIEMIVSENIETAMNKFN